MVPLLIDLAGATSVTDVDDLLGSLAGEPGFDRVRWVRPPREVPADARAFVVGEGALVVEGTADPGPLLDTLRRVDERLRHHARTDARARLFDALADRVADGVIVATPDGEVPVYNPALERLTGWSHAQVRERGWTNLVYQDAVARQEAQQAIAALTLGRPSEGVVRELHRADGSTFHAHIWSHLEPVDGGAPVMLGVLRSVASERSTTGLAPDRGLATRLAHEVANLLAAIVGHAELIAAADTDPRRLHHAETIVDSALRGGRLAREVLAHAEATLLHTTPTDLGALVQSVVDLLAVDLPTTMAMSVDVAPGLPMAEVDPGAMQQVFLNVLRNAVHACPTGSVRVTVGRWALPAEPSFSACASSDELLAVRVHDSGPGFSHEALAALFTPLYSERLDGHGLGLAAVRGLLAAQGGAVDVFNDDGAVVDVFVPVSVRPEVVLDALQATTAHHGRVVWVVERHPVVQEFARISLEGDGFRVFAFTPDDCPSELPAPDVVVAEAGWAGVPAGAAAIRLVAKDGSRAGPHLRKPFTGRALVAAVRSVLAGRDEEEQPEDDEPNEGGDEHERRVHPDPTEE